MPDVFAATRAHQGYHYTVVTIANGARPHTAEAELWYQQETGKPVGRWTYFRRHVATTGVEAARRVEADFREWVEGQREAEE
jgi:hypothetical protein